MSTLAQLRKRVRFNLGEPNPAVPNTRFFDESINNHINEGYQQYQLDLIENGEGDLATKVFINLVGSQEAYPLPANWVKTEKLERVTTFGTLPLDKFERYEASNVTISGSGGDWYLPTYRFRNRNIILEPMPLFSQVNGLVHEYYFLQNPLVLDSDSPVDSFIEPWQTMLVLYATVAELEGKEAVGGVADISSFNKRLEKAEMKFFESMNKRSQARDYVEPYGLNYDVTAWPY